jgi:hypothetical protein
MERTGIEPVTSGLQSPRPPSRARRARDQAPAHQAAPAAHEWQGRALHPDAAQRVGLCAHLRQFSRARGGPAALPNPLQLQTSTRIARPQAPGVTADGRRWELQLVELSRAIVYSHVRLDRFAWAVGANVEPDVARALVKPHWSASEATGSRPRPPTSSTPRRRTSASRPLPWSTTSPRTRPASRLMRIRISPRPWISALVVSSETIRSSFSSCCGLNSLRNRSCTTRRAIFGPRRLRGTSSDSSTADPGLLGRLAKQAPLLLSYPARRRSKPWGRPLIRGRAMGSRGYPSRLSRRR